MKELVKDAKPNDYLFFHCAPSEALLISVSYNTSDSGHGYRIHDDNGDESDQWDEGKPNN